jgi:hypothetical protein
MGVDSFETAIAARDYFRATSPNANFALNKITRRLAALGRRLESD